MAARIGRPPRPVRERLLEKVIIAPSGCWEWQGTMIVGYGYFFDGKKQRRAQRVVYELFVGPIPEGLVIDHLCQNPGCVNPDHLEPVTQAENLRRSDQTRPNNGAHNRAKTHCPHGHPYDEANTGRYKGERYCRTCKREAARRRRAHRSWSFLSE